MMQEMLRAFRRRLPILRRILHGEPAVQQVPGGFEVAINWPGRTERLLVDKQRVFATSTHEHLRLTPCRLVREVAEELLHRRL